MSPNFCREGDLIVDQNDLRLMEWKEHDSSEFKQKKVTMRDCAMVRV